MICNTCSAVSINSQFPFLKEKAQSRGWYNICMLYTKAIPWLCSSGDCWKKMDSKIQCLLWSLNVMNPKYPHIFPDTLSLWYSFPASRHVYWASRFPSPLPAFYRPRLPTTGPLPLGKGPEARPLVYPTLMALFSNSEPFAVEPSTLQELNLTWRPWAHSHRFLRTGGQIAPASLCTTVYLFTSYLIVIEGFQDEGVRIGGPQFWGPLQHARRQ